MLRKFHEAKQNGHSPVTLWGSGTPMREFLFVDDMATAVVFALENNLPDYLYTNIQMTHISACTVYVYSKAMGMIFALLKVTAFNTSKVGLILKKSSK